MNGLQQIHFMRPLWLLAIIPSLFIVLMLYQNRHKPSSWDRICDPHLLPYILSHHRQIKYRWPLLLFTIAWGITIIALAGPTWQQYTRAVYEKINARVIVVDMSFAMQSRDLKPSRLTRARYKLEDLLQFSKEGRTGMIAYAGEPYVVSPLTEDAHTISAMVSELSPDIMPVQGHNTAKALSLAGKLLTQAGSHQGDIILMTAANVDKKGIAMAASLAKKGYHTSVLGIGKRSETPIQLNNSQLLKDSQGNIIINRLDLDNLQRVATAGGGKYSLFTTDHDDILHIFDATQSYINEQARLSQQKIRLWQDNGYYLIWLLLPIALVAFRRGWLMELFQS